MSEPKNPVLPGALTRFIEQIGQVDDTAIAVLKAHLLIEEMLDGIISNFVFHPEYLTGARLGFAQKLQIARSMSLHEQANSMWRIGSALNALRNELAHKLEPASRARKIQTLFELYRRETVELPEAKNPTDFPEHLGLLLVCAFFLGFLTEFQAEVDRFKRLVNSLDAMMNPRPAKAKEETTTLKSQ